jgi:hypothetical protein
VARSRDLRDSTLGRLAILAIVLLIALLATRSCTGRGGSELSQAEATEIAAKEVVFEPDGTQVRYVQQGIPPRGTWIVSFYTGQANDPARVQTILVDAGTGEIVEQ